MQKKDVLSIVICTYNRAHFLDLNLESLCEAILPQNSIEILIIDNNSIDNTYSIFTKYRNRLNIYYFKERKQGLSYARNRGVLESNGNWILFLDDDCQVDKSILLEAEKAIKKSGFRMIGGIYKAWNYYEKPKWIKEDFGNYKIKGDSQYIRKLESNEYIAGGIFLICKVVLNNTKGFPIRIGMKGNKISYGEETFVEQELLRKGINIGINPKMIIYHLIDKKKFKLSWHLKSAFAKGRDGSLIFKGHKSYSIRRILRNTLWGCVQNPIKSLYLFMISSEYRIQNFVLDTIGSCLNNLGKIYGYYKSNN